MASIPQAQPAQHEFLTHFYKNAAYQKKIFKPHKQKANKLTPVDLGRLICMLTDVLSLVTALLRATFVFQILTTQLLFNICDYCRTYADEVR